MSENFINLQEFKKLMNVPLSVIIASSIIITITTNMTDRNGLTALLGGYLGLLLGLLFVLLLNVIFIKTPYLDMGPIIMVMIIIGLLYYYLNIYFERIIAGHVSNYYSGFSILSLLFLAIQLIIIFNVVYNKTQDLNGELFSKTTYALLTLFSVINILVVLTIGVILHFYSTQG
jgi:hypothetical protein